MAVYFGPVAKTCPSSRDQPPGLPRGSAGLYTRSTFPMPTDLSSAFKALDFARGIYNALAQRKPINNVYDHRIKSGWVAAVQDNLKHSKWIERKDLRIKNYYVYYGTNLDGTPDKTKWVVTERIEQMVWYDKTLDSYLYFTYGDKGEGQLIDDIIPPDPGPDAATDTGPDEPSP